MSRALAEIELMIQDGTYGATGADVVEVRKLEMPPGVEDRFLDGPACRRIGIVDFDPATGAPLPAPARFTPFRPEVPLRGRYQTKGLERTSPAFIAVNAFGTVFDTIRMFEEPGGLGRPVVWPFEGEQLLVVPRAGKWANAVYERDTR